MIFVDNHLDWFEWRNEFRWEAFLSEVFSFGSTLNSESVWWPDLDSTLLSIWALDLGSLVDVICVSETFFERNSCSSCLKRKPIKRKKSKQMNWIVCLSNHSARFFHCNYEFILKIIVTVVDSKFQNPIHIDQIEVLAPNQNGRVCDEWCTRWKILSEPSHPGGAIENASHNNVVRCVHQTWWRQRYLRASHHPVRFVWLFSVMCACTYWMCFLLNPCRGFRFSALFTSPLNDDVQSEVRIRDIRSPIMQNIIEYAYSRMAEVNADNVTEVMMWAHYFGYETLVDICASFILKNLDAENCISYMLDARYAAHFVHCRVNG